MADAKLAATLSFESQKSTTQTVNDIVEEKEATNYENDTYYLEEVSIEADSEDEFQYKEVPEDDDYSVSGNEGDEDFDTAVRAAREKESISMLDSSTAEVRVESRKRPEVVEDFVRNYLVHMNMMRTLDCFQTEWYELKEKGLLKEEDSNTVPDIYVRNRNLDELVNRLEVDVKKYKDAAQKAKDTHLKLRKERDFHRMHHKRIVQEKDKLISDIKRLKQHYASYEPALKALRSKYEAAMKEKMLTKLERDRAIGQIESLEAVSQYHVFTDAKGNITGTSPSKGYFAPDEFREKYLEGPMDSEFPPDKGVNPLLSKERIPCAHLTRSGGYRKTNTIVGHSLAVSGFALHPLKQILASVSDDKTWKLWSIPDGEMIMTGEGHSEWISDCEFSPEGNQICTTSGDTTVKVWDFASEKCVFSFDDHTHAVWGCTWHSAGDFIASCAMDCTSKIWDLNSLRCRNTLRGHNDSVNSIQFLPFSNTLCTCSADKTVSLWDARTGLCAQTLYGHEHAINHVTFNLQGNNLASCDAYGILNLWDVRNVSILASVDLGPQPINRVAFDPASTVIAAASNCGDVKMYEISTGDVTSLAGHEDAIQTVLFDLNGEYLVSGSSDATITIWS